MANKKPKKKSASAASQSQVGSVGQTVGSVLLALTGGLFMYLVVSNGFFLVGRALLIGLLPGLVVGMLVENPILSPVTAANAVALGVLISPPAAANVSNGQAWLLGTGLTSVVIAALSAFGATFARKAGIKSQVLGAAGLIFVIVVMWSGAIAVAGSAELSGDASLITALEAPVEPYPEMTDPEVYLFVHQRMAQGIPYNDAWNEIITALGPRYEQSAPVKYRLPTLQWFWNALPRSAWSLVISMLVFGTIACASAYWFAARLTAPSLGLLSAAAVATLYFRVASGPYLLQYEGWAAALNLLSLALGMESVRSKGSKALVLLWSAAGVALLAALTREIAVYFLLGAMIAGIVTSDGRRKKLWLPWVVAAVLVIGAYGLHIANLNASGHLPAGGFNLPSDYSNPPKGHFAATLAYGTWLLGGLPWLPWLAYGLAIVGSFALRGWLRWTSAWAVAAPTVAFIFFSPLTVSGNPAGYWGMLVTPLAFAIAPTIALLLPPKYGRDAQRASAEGLA